MTNSNHGTPCWYELATSEGNLKSAGEFYGGILGWKIEDSGMEGFDYHLAKSGDDGVAGLMATPVDADNRPPCWTIYFTVDDIDKFVSAAGTAGASVCRGPEGIPGVGRFALLADPQGAVFGILQPESATSAGGQLAFNQSKAGHGNWSELKSSDPVAGFAFYAGLFGWTRGESVDMGEMGAYQLLRHNGIDIGGMMGLAGTPVSHWLPYFGVEEGVSDRIEAVKAAGGSVCHGPVEVPGGAYIAVAQDPQGVYFAIVGARK